jgi:hypothetical protein
MDNNMSIIIEKMTFFNDEFTITVYDKDLLLQDIKNESIDKSILAFYGDGSGDVGNENKWVKKISTFERKVNNKFNISVDWEKVNNTRDGWFEVYGNELNNFEFV